MVKQKCRENRLIGITSIDNIEIVELLNLCDNKTEFHACGHIQVNQGHKRLGGKVLCENFVSLFKVRSLETNNNGKFF